MLNEHPRQAEEILLGCLQAKLQRNAWGQRIQGTHLGCNSRV